MVRFFLLVLILAIAGIIFWISTTAGAIFIALVAAFALYVTIGIWRSERRRYQCPACATQAMKMETSMEGHPGPSPVMHYNCQNCDAWFVQVGRGGAYEPLDKDAVAELKSVVLRRG